MPSSYGLLSIALLIALSASQLTGQEPTIKPRRAAAGGRLPAPAPVAARQLGRDKIQVSWGSVPDAAKYKITRSVPPAPQTVLAPVSDTMFVDSDVQVGKTYYYLVQAVDGSGIAGLNGGTSPVTVRAEDSTALREIKPVTALSAEPFPAPFVELNWISSQGGVSFIVERKIVTGDPKAAMDWKIRTQTQVLPCCHWGVVDEARDLPQTARVVYRVTAVDSASPNNRSSPVVSHEVAPWTTHSYQAKPGNFWLRPPTGETLTIHPGQAAHVTLAPGGGIASMDESIATTGRDGSILGKAAGVTYVVTIWKDYDGSPRISPFRVLVLP